MFISSLGKRYVIMDHHAFYSIKHFSNFFINNILSSGPLHCASSLKPNYFKDVTRVPRCNGQKSAFSTALCVIPKNPIISKISPEFLDAMAKKAHLVSRMLENSWVISQKCYQNRFQPIKDE